MYYIERFVESNKRVSENVNINNQSWSVFLQNCKNKKIVFWGVGALSVYIEKRCCKFVDINDVIIIDNNENRQRKRVGEYAFKECELANILIDGPKRLKTLDQKKTVILISSINGYENIIKQLNSLGFTNYYVALIMEINAYLTEKENYCDAYEWHVTKHIIEPIVTKKIVMQTFGTYSDHIKYIVEALLSIRNDLDIVLVLDENDVANDVPMSVRIIYRSNTVALIKEFETAYIWVINTIMPPYIKKRDNQFYIHTKHWSSITLKKFYLGSSTITDNKENEKNWYEDFKRLDYIISGSKFDEDSCRQGFAFDGKFINVGSPRSDALFNSEFCRLKVCSYYQISSDVKIALYAPTYRYKTTGVMHKAESRNIELDFVKLSEALKNRFGGKWLIMLRLHPSVRSASKSMLLKENVVDTSEYEDSQELCAACDVMISDYSSIMFEPAFVRKPVFLFATDIEEYIDKEYDLLLDYRSLPFSIAETNEQLVEEIMNFDNDKYVKDVDSFMEKYGVHEDGHASERAAQFISDLIDGKGM